MEERGAFLRRVRAALDEIDPQVLAYNKDEFWMIERLYEFVRSYAEDGRMFNTCIALELGRGLHDGSHRKSAIRRNGIAYKPPYFIHCLTVCRILINLKKELSAEEEDLLMAAAICHDMIEDLPFEHGGTELYTDYHLDPRIYEIVKTVSKRKDFTEAEVRQFFDGIQKNPLALLIKLSDRGNNVEDLYNMSAWKTHEYVWETRTYFLPMCVYGKENYMSLFNAIEILQEKIITLSEAAEILVSRYEQKEKELEAQVQKKRDENAVLKEQLASIRKRLEA